MQTPRLIIALAALGATLPASSSSHAQVPVIASDNIEVVAAIPDPGAIGGRILGDLLYSTSANGLRIYDLAAADGIPLLMSSLPLPTYQNEDIDTNGRVALLSSDFLVGVPKILTTVDVSDPSSPEYLATIQVPAAHTASCVLDCSFAWLGGASGRVHVVNLADPAAPVVLGSFTLPGLVHDIQVDEHGIAWASTSGGLFGLKPSATNPTAPQMISSLANNAPGAFENNSLLHNSLVRDDTIYVVEEDWTPLDNGRCANDGAFQTGSVTINPDGTRTVRRLDRFSLGQGTVGSDRLPFGPVSCSAHYFDIREDGVATVAWYEQGVRILDVSDPSDIRQIGYLLPPGETITTLMRGDLIYAFDTVLGLVVLRFEGGPSQAAVDAPILRAPTGTTVPSPEWGFACRIPVAA